MNIRYILFHLNLVGSVYIKEYDLVIRRRSKWDMIVAVLVLNLVNIIRIYIFNDYSTEIELILSVLVLMLLVFILSPFGIVFERKENIDKEE